MYRGEYIKNLTNFSQNLTDFSSSRRRFGSGDAPRPAGVAVSDRYIFLGSGDYVFDLARALGFSFYRHRIRFLRDNYARNKYFPSRQDRRRCGLRLLPTTRTFVRASPETRLATIRRHAAPYLSSPVRRPGLSEIAFKMGFPLRRQCGPHSWLLLSQRYAMCGSVGALRATAIHEVV